jgi:NTE family protein
VLVLSVGGAEGLAHLGAIAALKEARLDVAAVVGNSAGALVGALYASAPGDDTAARLQALANAYAEATRRDKLRNGTAVGLLFSAVAAVATHGKVLPALAAGGGGFLIGAGFTEEMDQARLVRVMRAEFSGARLETLPIPFVTFHHRVRGEGVEVVAVRTGDLAEAVGASLANPLLFPDVQSGLTREGQRLDPGADRVAATPVEDACRLFPGANILAINVTGHPAFYSGRMSCPLREVLLAPSGLTPQELLRVSPRATQAITAAHDAVAAALGGPPRRPPRPQ